MMSFFENLFRYFTNDSIEPSVSQEEGSSDMTKTAKNENSNEPEVIVDNTLYDDIAALAKHFGLLQNG